MVPLGDEAQVETPFRLLDIVLILTQDRFAVCAVQAQKSFWMRPMELLGDVGHVESCFGLLGDNVGVGQDRCTVYAKRTIGSAFILDVPDGTPR